jgi:hypothetical protein
MMARIRFMATTMAVAATMLLGMLALTGSAKAQCSTITVTNNQLGAINLILAGQNGSTDTHSIPAAIPGGGGNPGVPGKATYSLPAGFVITGVKGATGITHTFAAQPPSPGCAFLPSGFAACIGLPATTQPPTVWCASVCYDDSACTILLATCPVNICAP